MAEIPPLGAVVKIDGHLYECVGTGSGVTVYFQRVGASDCPMCGSPQRRSYLLHARNYEIEVQPVTTVTK